MSNSDNLSNKNDPGIPNWILFAFFGVILIGLGYAIFMHGFLNYDQNRAFQSEKTRFVVGKIEKVPRSAKAITKGEQLSGGCAGCHGAGLKGGPLAPNLLDAKWLHNVNSESELYKIIVKGISPPNLKYGNKATPMPALGALSNNADVWRVVYFISSKNKSIKKDAK